MARHFFLNYGDPGHKWISDSLEITNNSDGACRKLYRIPTRKLRYTIRGIDVSVCTYGFHRALRMDIPDDASQDTIRAFEQAKN